MAVLSFFFMAATVSFETPLGMVFKLNLFILFDLIDLIIYINNSFYLPLPYLLMLIASLSIMRTYKQGEGNGKYFWVAISGVADSLKIYYSYSVRALGSQG